MTPSWTSIPQLAEAVARRRAHPLVQVGDEVKYPSGISIYWAEEELRSLGVDHLRRWCKGGD